MKDTALQSALRGRYLAAIIGSVAVAGQLLGWQDIQVTELQDSISATLTGLAAVIAVVSKMRDQ